MPSPKKPKIPATSPKTKTSKDPESLGMTAPLDHSSSMTPTTDIGKLDQLAEKIKRDRNIDSAVDQIQTAKEDQLLSGPAVETFVPDPALVQIGAGMTFFAMKKISNFFEKDLSPLTEMQKASLERILDKLARKYLPASLAKYQEHSEIFLVIGGIVISNLTDLRKPSAAPRKEAERGTTLPEIPQANVTVITAEAPPVPQGVS